MFLFFKIQLSWIQYNKLLALNENKLYKQALKLFINLSLIKFSQLVA